MPGFVKTKKDEARWSKAKDAAGKQVDKGSESYWKLANYIYHKMGKTEEDQQHAELLKADLLKAPKAPKTARVPGLKTNNKLAGAFAKPSVFFKKEDFGEIKKSSIENLRSFLETHRSKK